MNTMTSTRETTEPAPGQGGLRHWLADWGQAWNGFWFTPADPLPLAVVRIATGLILAWSCLVWLLDADAFFGPRGWLAPGEVWRMNDQPWQWSWFLLLRYAGRSRRHAPRRRRRAGDEHHPRIAVRDRRARADPGRS
jgi:hypothetical protein